MIGLLYALLSPILYGIVNVYDKFVVEHRVKNHRSYAVFSGAAILLFSIITALFLDWGNIRPEYLIFPVITGTISGINSWLYYKIISKEDISHVVGMIYIYPLIVSALSFLFIGEKLSIIGYFGALITITGAVLLSSKIKNIKKGIFFFLGILIINVGISEFLIKIVTGNIPAVNGMVISNICVAIVLLSGLLVKEIRTGAFNEKKSAYLALIGEPFYFFGSMMLFLAMSDLPATIVSSISAIQPLVVLIFESIINKHFRISSSEHLKDKIIAISLIILGVVLLYVTEI